MRLYEINSIIRGKSITSRAEDYNQWYLDIIEVADLAEHAPVKGCMIIKPYGYALWEKHKRILDDAFKKQEFKMHTFLCLFQKDFSNVKKPMLKGSHQRLPW